MSGIHTSKEVYKYTPTNDGLKLVPVRGLYVSGLHTEPWYIDHCVSITTFTSNTPTIADYYETEITESFSGMHLVGFNHLNPNIRRYATNSLMSIMSGMHLVGFQANHPTLLKYTGNSYPEAFSGMHLVRFQSLQSTIIKYTKQTIDSSLEHCISITHYQTTEPLIEDAVTL